MAAGTILRVQMLSIHPESLIPAVLLILMLGEKPDSKVWLPQIIKDINAQVIEVTSIIADGDLELLFGDERDAHETLAKQTIESSPPPLTRSKRLRKRTMEGYVAELPVASLEPKVEVAAAVPGLVVEKDRTAGVLIVAISPLKPPIVAMPIHSLPGSSTTTSFADPELAEFEAMDLDLSWTNLTSLAPLLARPSPRLWMRQWIG
ncbi:unnamed protein product [Prunus armeniaca]